MKICILADRIPPESNGGGERAAWGTALALSAKGHDVSVITTTPRPLAGIEERIVQNIRVFYIHSAYAERWRSWRSLYNPAPVRAVRDILKKLEPDIVHAHNIHYHLSYAALGAARRAGARVYLTAHDVMPFHYGKLVEFTDPAHPVCRETWDYRVSTWQQLRRFKRWYNPLRNAVIRRRLRTLDGFFSVSDALRQALRQNGLPDSRVIHTGIDADAWRAQAEATRALREKFGLDGRLVIFFGGRINAMKGGDAIVRAMHEVVKRVPSALLLVVGTRDRYFEKLEGRMRELGLQKNIGCTGWLEGRELRAAYHVSDVVAIPSVCFDSFPLTALEAMACGKPVIATCFGGSRESVLDGETGYIVNPYDTASLAARLCELLSDGARREAFGKAGLARVQNAFSLEGYTLALEKHYAA